MTNSTPSISLSNISVSYRSKVALENITLKLMEGNLVALTGPTGSGKTTLGNVIAKIQKPTSGNLNFNKISRIAHIPQQDNFIGVSKQKSSFYSARYEFNASKQLPKVLDYLKEVKNIKEIPKVVSFLNLESIQNKELLVLSNGERKRTLIARSILDNPELLIFDQPFVGLDNTSREIIKKLMIELKKEGKIIFLICNEEDFFKGIDKIIQLNNGKIHQQILFENFKRSSVKNIHHTIQINGVNNIYPTSLQPYQTIVEMVDVNVRIKDQHILKNINWKVNANEKWALLGHNGAGKTTLLSLITADNPQAYKNQIMLFDRKRGSGESIWDIKSKIGFVSPELHLNFLRGQGIYNSVPGIGENKYGASLNCIDVVGSGIKDEVGLSTSTTAQERELAANWLSIFNLKYLADKNYSEISYGEQRLLLLVRALIKNPPLLILDEPCQGLNAKLVHHFTSLLGELNKFINFTLIYVTHNLEEIPDWINNKIILNKGEVGYINTYQKRNLS